MSEVGTAEHGDPAGFTRDAWGSLPIQPASGVAGVRGDSGSVPVPLPRLQGAPEHWTPEQEEGFRRFHQEYAEKLLLYADGKLPSRFDAEDAVHSTFEVVVRIWPKVMAMEFPAAYAWRVLKNRIADLYRKGSRIEPVDDERLQGALDRHPAGDPGTEVVDLMSLQGEIRELPDRQQEALVLEALGLPIGQVAELMGIKEESARMYLKRARARLKRRLGTHAGRGRK
ncbi:RNA polymerase sigma factor [Streptomyces sp. NPDC054975]